MQDSQLQMPSLLLICSRPCLTSASKPNYMTPLLKNSLGFFLSFLLCSILGSVDPPIFLCAGQMPQLSAFWLDKPRGAGVCMYRRCLPKPWCFASCLAHSAFADISPEIPASPASAEWGSRGLSGAWVGFSHNYKYTCTPWASTSAFVGWLFTPESKTGQ